MPDGLETAVRARDEIGAEIAMRNWDAIGDKGRGYYFAYLSLARTRRGRRKRCQLAAEQLIDPYSALRTPRTGF